MNGRGWNGDMNSGEPTIHTRDLTKVFDGILAVDGMNLEIGEGEVFGLLGPNGAGKTTLLSMLSTLLPPTSGSAVVNGYDVLSQGREVRASIGVLFQEHSLDEKATGRENLEMAAAFYGVDRRARRGRIGKLLELVGLGERADSYVRGYSSGMKRALEIARAVLHKPKILILDEPTLGLDPHAREKMWDFMGGLEDVTILLATNYLEEAERLCTRIGIIHEGRIVAVDSPGRLKATLGGDVIYLRTSAPEEVLPRLKGVASVKEAKLMGDKIVLTVKDWEKAIPGIAEAMGGEYRIESMEVYRPTLSDVFMHYTGKRMEEA